MILYIWNALYNLPIWFLQIKEAATPVYGERVEHLKSVIKSCGMRFLIKLLVDL